MIRTQVSFDRPLYQRAKETARRQGLSLAELCRRSVAEAVSREDALAGRPWMRYVGIVEGTPEDSMTVDAVVYDREAL